jgi:hypothetical protein
MIGSHLNAKATGAPTLVDVDNVSPTKSTGTDDRGGDSSEFGTTFGDLIDANQQKVSPTVRPGNKRTNSPQITSSSAIEMQDKEISGSIVSFTANWAKPKMQASEITESVRNAIKQNEELFRETTSHSKLIDSANPKAQLIPSNPADDTTPLTGEDFSRDALASSSVVTPSPEERVSDPNVVSSTSSSGSRRAPVATNVKPIEASRSAVEVEARAPQTVTQPVFLPTSQRTEHNDLLKPEEVATHRDAEPTSPNNVKVEATSTYRKVGHEPSSRFFVPQLVNSAPTSTRTSTNQGLSTRSLTPIAAVEPDPEVSVVRPASPKSNEDETKTDSRSRKESRRAESIAISDLARNRTVTQGLAPVVSSGAEHHQFTDVIPGRATEARADNDVSTSTNAVAISSDVTSSSYDSNRVPPLPIDVSQSTHSTSAENASNNANAQGSPSKVISLDERTFGLVSPGFKGGWNLRNTANSFAEFDESTKQSKPPTNVGAIENYRFDHDLSVAAEFIAPTPLNSQAKSWSAKEPSSRTIAKQSPAVRDNVHLETTQRGSSDSSAEESPLRVNEADQNPRLDLSAEDTEGTSAVVATNLLSVNPTGTTEHTDGSLPRAAAAETSASVSARTDMNLSTQEEIDAPLTQLAQPSRSAITPTAKTLPLSQVTSSDSAGSSAPSSRGTTESAPIRQIQEATLATELTRVANLRVVLADGQTANATVRERAGSIDVRIVTPTNASAQRVSSEVDTMRQNFDAAGLRLGQADVSYQPGDGGRHSGNEHQSHPQKDASANGDQIFTINEVTE